MHAVMAQDVPEVLPASASSSAPPSCTWWDQILHANSNSNNNSHSNPFSSSTPAWSSITMTHRWPPPPSNHRHSSSYDDGAATSFTNDSSSADLSTEAPAVDYSHHLWDQALMNVENGGDERQNSHGVDDGENFLQVLSSKRLNNYADKMDQDCNWPELLHPSSSTSSLKCLLEKHLSNPGNGRAANYNLSDLVSNWSLAPPSSSTHLAPSTNCDAIAYNNVCHPMARYEANLQVQLSSSSSSSSSSPSSCDPISNYSASFGMRRDQSQMNIPWFNHRSSYLQQQMMPLELQALKPPPPPPHAKGSDLLLDGNNKQGCESSSPMKGNIGRTSPGGTIEGLKKKRSEESSEMHLKKKKYDSASTTSSNNKLQVPKVKMAEKISALQQLVSPFGKTDQASVLMETINCIKVLQEQVQLLSDPYLKSGVSKELNPWGEVLEMRKEKTTGAGYDLRSRGLCLVPISSIPQVHRESCRPDYWMPTYRSCFYR